MAKANGAGGRPLLYRRTRHGHRSARLTTRAGARVTVAELRLTLLAGCLLGLVYAQMQPGLPSGIPLPAIVGEPSSGVRTIGRTASFGRCHSGGGYNCVVDGDTFWFEGTKIRIAGIDTPETHPARCADEAALGERATLRLQTLLMAGPFELRAIDRDEDRYGRKLRNVYRNGRSLGDTLIAKGLARPYGEGRRSWCA